VVNVVAVTVKVTDSTADGFARVKEQATLAGAEAAEAFNGAFKAAADANVKVSASGGDVARLKGAASGGSEGISGLLDSGGVAGGALPGVAGISGMAATITGLAGAMVAVLPAIAGVVAGLGAIGGGFLILEKTNKQFAADMSSTMKTIEGVFTEAAQPLAAPLEEAAKSIGSYFKEIEPELKSVFGDSGALVKPLVQAFEGLTSGALPGFLAIIKAGGPVFAAFAQSMSGLGRDLGSMLEDFASAGPGSATILKSLMSVIGSLLPLVGTLAKSIVGAVAPAFTALSGALTDVMPALTPLMSIIGQFAGAVLSDLASVLKPIGQLLKDLAPSFTDLAKAAASVFTALENDGVFATFGNVLEGLAGPLANLVNALVKGIAPALPGIVQAFGQLANVASTALSAALAGIANALAALVKAIPPSVLVPIVDSVVALFAAFKGYALITAAVEAVMGFAKAMGALNIVIELNPIGILVTALAALAAGIYLAWEKSSTFRDVLQNMGSAMLAVGIVIVAGARDITDAFLSMVGAVIKGAADAFGWIPGIGGKLQAASAAFSGMKASVNGSFDSMISKMQGWQSDLTGANHTVSTVTNQINGDFSSQATAAKNAGTALTGYTNVIKANGVSSDAAKAARAALISDMTKAGVQAGIANKDVAAYTTAVKDNGSTSSAAQAAREKLINDILDASNNAKAGKTALDNYTTAVKTNGSDSSAAAGARATLIRDLENAGLSAKAATGLVAGLTGALNKVPHSVTSVIDIEGKAQGTLTAISTTLAGQKTEASLALGVARAAGGHIRGPGGPKGDKIPAWLSDNEYVVQADAVSHYGTSLLDAINSRRFASGGSVDTSAGSSFVNAQGESWAKTVENQWQSANWAAFEKALQAAAAASTAQSLIHPTGSGATVQALMQSMAASVGWTGAEWTALNNVEMREAGYNLTATNPSSGAYGLAQFINGPSEYAQYGGNSTTAQGQITAMLNYIKQRYGDPEAAWAHEESAGWYDHGGWLKPGYSKVYNGTGYPEQVIGPSGGGAPVSVQLEIAGSGQSAVEAFLLETMRNLVRVKGGGSVQAAFGRN
jgi:hypothetical protein